MTKFPTSHFLLAAPSSNSGKTTLTLGLLRVFANQGRKVQPFKCGPDYIDTLHHTTAAGNPSINLDTFMASEAHVREIYQHHASQADIAVTEGVMGLFDGMNKMQASSAAVAELLNIPIILVINAKAMAYSVAPLLYGFKNFYPGIRIAGAIFNFVNTESHYRFLQEACEDVGVEALGYLPANPELAMPSRHLGLHISSETNYERIIEQLAQTIPQTVDVEQLLEITRVSTEGVATAPAKAQLKHSTSCSLIGSSGTSGKPLKIAIARDEAFSFTYQQNLEMLSQLGEITYFSPLNDSLLPKTDFLYLPGGYPELFVQSLTENSSMRESIRGYCDRGGLTYAECGGMMYLGEAINDAEGNAFPMIGSLAITTSMEKAKMTLGYRIIQWNGLEMRGHEFHYSQLVETTPLASIANITNARGIEVPTKLYRQYNTFASYIHLYWADHPHFIEYLLQQAAKFEERETRQ